MRFQIFGSLFWLSCCVLALSACAGKVLALSDPGESSAGERTVLGWEERVTLLPENILVEAKLTPGSEGNVLHVDDIEIFKKKDKKWVRFKVSSRRGGTKTLERPLLHNVSFKSADATKIRRRVVRIGICLAGRYSEIDVALGNRSHLDHEMRIGRDTLSGNFVVDPGLSHVSEPECVVEKRVSKSAKSR